METVEFTGTNEQIEIVVQKLFNRYGDGVNIIQENNTLTIGLSGEWNYKETLNQFIEGVKQNEL